MLSCIQLIRLKTFWRIQVSLKFLLTKFHVNHVDWRDCVFTKNCLALKHIIHSMKPSIRPTRIWSICFCSIENLLNLDLTKILLVSRSYQYFAFIKILPRFCKILLRSYQAEWSETQPRRQFWSEPPEFESQRWKEFLLTIMGDSSRATNKMLRKEKTIGRAK